MIAGLFQLLSYRIDIKEVTNFFSEKPVSSPELPDTKSLFITKVLNILSNHGGLMGKTHSPRFQGGRFES